MTPQHALLFLGLFTIGAVALCFAALAWMHFTRAQAALIRERALPPGKKPLNPELWDGKAALDRARAAADEVHG